MSRLRSSLTARRKGVIGASAFSDPLNDSQDKLASGNGSFTSPFNYNGWIGLFGS
nr:hypothetical protein [Cressdnaviricota sp.]UOF82258.1 hypothetical protein [Cressdnaviricota sp.]